MTNECPTPKGLPSFGGWRCLLYVGWVVLLISPPVAGDRGGPPSQAMAGEIGAAKSPAGGAPASAPDAPAVTIDPVTPLLPLPPLVGGPLPWPSDRLIPAPVPPPVAGARGIPPSQATAGEIPGGAAAPRPLPADAPYPLHGRPALDVPPIASVWDLPPPRALPALPLARADAPDPSRPMPLPAGRPALADDPAAALAAELILSVAAPLRSAAAPFLRLAIPDPFEAITAVHLAQPPPDTAPPIAPFDTPPRPTLPTGP